MEKIKYKNVEYHKKKGMILFSLIGIIVVLSVLAIIFSHSRMINQTFPLILTTERINNKVTTAHLWLKEYLSGDLTINLEKDVLSRLDEAEKLNSDLLENQSDVLQVDINTYPFLMETFKEVEEILLEIELITVQRIDDLKNAKSGSSLDQKYDQYFKSFTGLMISAENGIKNIIKENERVYNLLHISVVLLVLSLVVFGVLLYFFYKRSIIKIKNDQTEAERKLSTLMNNLKGMVYRCRNNKDYTMLFVSSGSIELTGYTPEDFLNSNVTYGQLIFDKDSNFVFNSIMNSINKHGHYEMVYRIKTKKNEIKYVWERGIEVKVSNQKDPLLEGFIMDITSQILDRQNLEKERLAAETLAEDAKKANKAKTQFLANISHEIRTPLNGIVGFSALLVNSELNNTQQEYADSIYSSARTLLKTVNNILDFSKVEANKVVLYEKEVDLKSYLIKTASVLSNRIHLKNLEYDIIIDKTLPALVLLDPLKLTQTLMNLLGNALKFTEKGKITFIAEKKVDNQQTSLRISIKDTGIGISKENQELIFDLFTQADGSLTRKYGGTGIGLSLSKIIIEKMGGHLQVESKIGEGSNFYFQIPLKILEGKAVDY